MVISIPFYGIVVVVVVEAAVTATEVNLVWKIVYATFLIGAQNKINVCN